MRPTFGIVLIGTLLSIGVGSHFEQRVEADEAGQPAAENSTRELPPIPEGPLGDTIRLGRDLVNQTSRHPLTRPYIGNSLNCTSCHLEAGTDPRAATFLGVATAYPAWAPREGRVITLEDRILNCFIRSGNGKRPAVGSKVSIAIAAYITWLSSGQPIAMNAKQSLGPNAVKPMTIDPDSFDKARGETLYADRCAGCHGDDGEGDDDNPPVWGELSYNDGAGMAINLKLASWLKVAMPPGETDLSDAECGDLAAYINAQPRPRFRP